MGQNLQSGDRLRPVDLAREHGLSTQAIRNYEEDGILPPAGRTPTGYRVYTRRHVLALRAFLALIPAHGHPAAAAILRAVHGNAPDEAFRVIDESHVQLLEDRHTLRAVEDALRGLAPAAAPGRGDTFIGPLAARLQLRPATLRAWERAGIVRPERDPRTGYRVYSDADVRDAMLAHQLRRGGYRLDRIAPLLAQVRSAGGLAPLEAALGDWRDRLSDRGRAMLAGAALLDTYLSAIALSATALSGAAPGATAAAPPA